MFRKVLVVLSLTVFIACSKNQVPKPRLVKTVPTKVKVKSKVSHIPKNPVWKPLKLEKYSYLHTTAVRVLPATAKHVISVDLVFSCENSKLGTLMFQPDVDVTVVPYKGTAAVPLEFTLDNKWVWSAGLLKEGILTVFIDGSMLHYMLKAKYGAITAIREGAISPVTWVFSLETFKDVASEGTWKCLK